MQLNILITLNLLFLTHSIVLPQEAQELNKKSKEFLHKQDYKNAFPFLVEAAELGHSEAQYNLGCSYLEGLGTQKDQVRANVWFEKAALQNYVDAQFKLAYSYILGRGIKADTTMAFKWFLSAAENSDAEAQFTIIGMFKEGIGVKKDVAMGLDWARKLAKRKTPEDLRVSGQITSARHNLALMYLRGDEGIEIDLVESYKWFLITNESKVDFSVIEQQSIIDYVKDLQGKIASDEQKRAIVEAEAFLGRPLENIEDLKKVEY